MTKNNLHNILSNNFNLKLNIINDLQAHAKKSFIFHLVDENFVNSIKSEKNIDNTISSVWNNNVLKSMKNQMENEDFKGAEKTSMLLLSQCDQFERIYLIGVSKIIEEDKKNSAKDRNNDNQITEEKIKFRKRKKN